MRIIKASDLRPGDILDDDPTNNPFPKGTRVVGVYVVAQFSHERGMVGDPIRLDPNQPVRVRETGGLASLNNVPQGDDARKNLLLNHLSELTSVDSEQAHKSAENALLSFIDDPEVTAAFEKVPKWYA